MKDRNRTKSSVLFVDAVNDSMARLLPEEGLPFDLPLSFLPSGIREGEVIKLTASLQDNKEMLRKTDALLLNLKNKE